jgi:hypothetical protein
VAADDPDRLVANPLRGRLLTRARRLEKDLVFLEQEHGIRKGRAGMVLGLGRGAPERVKQQWQAMADELAAVDEGLGRTPTRLSWAEYVEQTGREAFTYGPKLVQDVLRVVALNAEHALREVVREDYPNPRHERRLVRMMLHAPGTYQLQDSSLTVRLRGPERRWRLRRAAAHLLQRLTLRHTPHPARPDITLRWELEPTV